MPDPMHSLMNYIRVATGALQNDPRDDPELLSRFAETRDETAFAALIWRHGAMVWRTCKHILGNKQDTEDAFQNVFLALARKAGQSVVKCPAGWLHKVARETALNARRTVNRRREDPKQRSLDAIQSKTENVDQGEHYAVLDEELASLPEKLRVPLVLRYLEEKTQDEVARILGCSRTGAQKRLAKGETLLRKRLERRGLALGAGGMVTLFGKSDGIPIVSARLIESTARAAIAFRAGTLTGVTASAAQKLLRSLAMQGVARTAWWIVLASVGCLGVGGAGLVAWKMCQVGSDAVAPAAPAMPDVMVSKTTVESRGKRVDCYGDPLPEGAIARIGTVRFRGPGRNPLGGLSSLAKLELRTGVALSPDGKILVLACKQDGLHFWDVATGRELFKSMNGDRQVIFSPDGKALAATVPGSEGPYSNVQLLDPANGQPTGDSFPGDSPVFAPDSKVLACRTEWDSFTLYDVRTKRLLHTLRVKNLRDRDNKGCFTSQLTFAEFSRDGRSLACVEEAVEGTVHLFDVKTGKETATLKKQKVVALVFTPEGNIVTAGLDKIVRVWNAENGKELRSLGELDWQPTMYVRPIINLMPDGKTIVAVYTGQIRFWDLASGKETQPPVTCKDLLYPAIFSTDGTKLIERVGNAISIRDTATGKEIGPTAGAPRSLMRSLAFSPDGKMLVTVTEPVALFEKDFTGGIRFWKERAVFRIWEATTGNPLGSLAIPADISVKDFWKVIWPSRNIIQAQASLGSTTGKGTLTMLRWTKVSPGGVADRPEIYADESEEFSQDGQVRCRRGRDLNYELLEVTTGKKLADVPSLCKNAYFGDIEVLSADHQLFATQQLLTTLDDRRTWRTQRIILWDVPGGHKLYSFDLPINPSKSPGEEAILDRLIGMSPDNRLVVTEHPKTRAISLWEHISGQRRLRLDMPARCGRIGNVTFSPDSYLLAVGCVIGEKESCVHMWDLTTGQECQHFQKHQAGDFNGSIPGLAFSSDGQRFATSGEDYTALIWDIKPLHIPAKVNKLLTQEDLQALKTTLGGGDAAAAYHAMCKLQQVPEQAVPLVAECLHPDTSSPDLTKVGRQVSLLIGDLDSNDFQTRMKAAEELGKKLTTESGNPIIEIIENMLRKALADKPSVEVSHAITRLLDKLKNERESKGWGGAGSPELTRMVRAIEVLERINNGPARELLGKLIESPPRPEIRREAQAALKRLLVPQLDPVP